MKKRNLLWICVIVLISGLMSGCSQADVLKVKMGLKNNDFEYIKQGKVKKIVIQNKRDKSYTFIVTNPAAISELYDILSDAKVVTKKSSLKPDYEFDLYEDGNKVQQFNYIAGLDTKNGGNLYSNNKCYIIPSRIDSDILKNFNEIRTPKDFNKLYYTFIIQCLEKYRSAVKADNKTIGIDINNDTEVNKYIISTDLEDFKDQLPPKSKLLENINDTADIIESVNTDGYKYGSFTYGGKSQYGYIYKSTVTFYDNAKKQQKKYSVVGTYNTTNDNDWNIYISDAK